MRSSFKKMWRGSALLLILYVLTPSSLSAQPLVQSGTRVDAMGGAFLAVSNDANALQFSPAGLLNTPAQWLAEVGYHRMFLGIDGLGMTQIGAARNFSHRRKGRQVLVPRFVDASGLVLASPAPSREQDTLTQRISFGAQAQIQSFPGYNQNAVRGTVAYGFFPRTEESHMTTYDDTTRQAPYRVSLGLGGRYLWIELNEDFLRDPTHVNNPGELAVIRAFLDNNTVSSNDWALDASLTYYFNRKLQAALSVINLRQPNLAAKLSAGKKSSFGLYARRYRAGVAYRVQKHWLAAVDVEKNPEVEGWINDFNLYAGAEYAGIERLILRGGFNRNWLALGLGFTLVDHIRLHGAWQHDLHGVNFNNLRFAFSFGR